MPVGAVDADLGVVEQAYQMILPPRLEPLTAESLLNISPLTSAVWEAVESQLAEQVGELSCGSVIASEQIKEQLVTVLAESIADVVQHYNIPESELFEDFVASGNTEVQASAVKIVKGLKKSLVATSELQAEFPSATWAKVNYYFFSSLDGDDLYPDAWYRDLELYNGDSIIKQLTKVSDDLSTDIRPILFEETAVSTVDGVSLRLERGYESRNGDDSVYSCNAKEELSTTLSGVEYQLVNISSEAGIEDVDNCQIGDFSASTKTRYVFVRDMSEIPEIGAQFSFQSENTTFSSLTDWFNFTENFSSLDIAEFTQYAGALPYQFCDSGLAGASLVNRSKSASVAGDEIVLNRLQDGSYERTVKYADGTSLTETASADEALELSWDVCEEVVDFDQDGVPDAIDPDDDNDGVVDGLDAFPLDSTESLDTDNDRIGNNADPDDDNDGLIDANDDYPLDAGNVVDTDGDGVVDRDDVFPEDASIADALRVDFMGATQLGFGTVVDRDEAELAYSLEKLKLRDKGLLAQLVSILIPQAWADDINLQSLTNAIGWGEGGSLIADTILSTETKFIAEASVSPDGQFLYLLTSAHIQRALQGMDQEVCSIYRVDLDDNSHRCLLNVRDGDVQPRSLNSGLRFDNSRGGMVFRADGAALVHGFNWQRLDASPEPCECASGSVWFMSPDGELTDLPRDSGWEASTAVWINDDYFAVPESSFEDGSGERIAVYDSQTLERIKFIVDEADGVTLSLLRAGSSIHWSGYSMSSETLEVSPSGQNGYPVVDQSGTKLFYFSEPQILSADGSVEIDLVKEGAQSYNWQQQSGIGTDIKYTPLVFSSDYIAYMQTLPPLEPILSFEGETWFGGETDIELSDGRGSVRLHGMNFLQIFPSDTLTGDLVFDYQVQSDSGAESRTAVLAASVIAAWRADEEGGDHLNWILPESEREGICVYAHETAVNKCAELTDYQVLAFDLESLPRRYDDNAVYGGTGHSANPGVSNVVLLDDTMRVYFKDSMDHTYYEARADVVEFIDQGEAAFSITEASNGAGEVNIIAAATKLTPRAIGSLEGVSVTEVAARQIRIDFDQPLSAYAALPQFEVWSGATQVLFAAETEWNTDRNSATVSLSSLGYTNGVETEVRLVDPVFLVDDIRRYQLAEELIFTPSGSNAFTLSGTTVTLNDYNPSSQAFSSNLLTLSSTEGTLNVDLRSNSLNLLNMQNATNGGDFRSPTLSFSLQSLAIGEGSATVTINVVDGVDGSRTDGERQISLELLVDWVSDGVNASVTVPPQSLVASYVTAAGTLVELEIENDDADMISITSNGVSYPATLDIKLLSALTKVSAVSPSSILRSGTLHVNVATTLPLADRDNAEITELNAIIQIGN